jgi:hypothetical protein
MHATLGDCIPIYVKVYIPGNSSYEKGKELLEAKVHLNNI